MMDFVHLGLQPVKNLSATTVVDALDYGGNFYLYLLKIISQHSCNVTKISREFAATFHNVVKPCRKFAATFYNVVKPCRKFAAAFYNVVKPCREFAATYYNVVKPCREFAAAFYNVVRPCCNFAATFYSIRKSNLYIYINILIIHFINFK
jgi:hypothetical protein